MVERKATPLSASLADVSQPDRRAFRWRFLSLVATVLPAKEWLEGWRDACGVGGVAWSERGSSSVASCCSLEVVDN